CVLRGMNFEDSVDKKLRHSRAGSDDVRLESRNELPAIDDDTLSDDEASVLAAQERAKSANVLGIAEFERWNAHVGNPFIHFLFVCGSVLLGLRLEPLLHRGRMKH